MATTFTREIYGEKVIGRARKIGFKQVSEKAKNNELINKK